MKRLVYKAGVRVLMLVFLSLGGALLGATLVRFSPGYGMDERTLDPRLNQASVDAIRNSYRIDSGLIVYYGRYLERAIHGDFGVSLWLQRPVSVLIRERLPITLRSVLMGLVIAWTMALAFSLGSLFRFGVFSDLVGALSAGLLISLPAAVVAMFSMYARAPVGVAIAVVTFPKLFRYLRNLLAHAYGQPHILAARARGIGSARIVFRHIMPSAMPAILALLGLSLSIGFGAAIPIEALCESPGIGQLAWQASLNRDLPLIMNLTLLITVVTVGVNSLANLWHEATL